MARTMPGLVNYAPEHGSVELREVPVPEIGEQDVLLKVQAVSICGSDLHQWHGTHSWKVNYPCILGHEFCGTIEQAGKRVKNFKEGDRVISETAAVIDEFSPYTRRGLYNLDPNRLGFGYGVNGAMTHYARVPERCLHAMPAQLHLRKGCPHRALLRGLQRSLYECPHPAGRFSAGHWPRTHRVTVRLDGQVERSRASDGFRSPCGRWKTGHRKTTWGRCDAGQRGRRVCEKSRVTDTASMLSSMRQAFRQPSS